MTAITAPQPVKTFERAPVINDFSIQVATVNGSGSQTANTTLLRALFKMGIPVSGKNLFPSNISGLPTWYTIRVNKDGYVARRERAEVLVAMNKATIVEDIAKLWHGGLCLYPDDVKIATDARPDVTFYPMPPKRLMLDLGVEADKRTLVANMVYVGILAHLLGIELPELESALNFHFKGRAKLVTLNMGVLKAAHDWAAGAALPPSPYRVERLGRSNGQIMIDGNTAAALGAIYGGVTFVAWYPITPATSLADALNEYLPKLRRDPQTGEASYSVVQAEDELAALGMAIGAGWAGARSMTSTSGPGISLMTEFAGFGHFAEIPTVIWDVQRIGPSTGMPTRVSQGDVLKVYFLGHGDTKHVVLLPSAPRECFEFGWRALDLAERLQTPVFVLSDLDIGMNQWISEPLEYPDEPMDRGKVLSAEDLKRLGGFARYKDVDGDGIPYRTLPGTDHPKAAYFTRGSGHTEEATYTERPEEWVRNMDRLDRKFDTARGLVPQPVVDEESDSKIGFIYFGSVELAVKEARHRLGKSGVHTSALRLRALPMNGAVRDFVEKHDRVYVVEMDSDAQLCQLVRLHLPDMAGRVQPLNHGDGLPLTARWIIEALEAREQ